MGLFIDDTSRLPLQMMQAVNPVLTMWGDDRCAFKVSCCGVCEKWVGSAR